MNYTVFLYSFLEIKMCYTLTSVIHKMYNETSILGVIRSNT